MFAFTESLKRQEIKLISPNANISLLSIKDLTSDTAIKMYTVRLTTWADCLRFKPVKLILSAVHCKLYCTFCILKFEAM